MARRKRRRSGRATTMPKRGWRIANTNSLLLQWYSGGAEATFLSYRIKWGAAVNTLQSCSPTRQPTTDKTTRIRFMECYLQSWLSFVPFFFCFVFLFFILLLSKCTTRTTYIVEWMYDARVCVCAMERRMPMMETTGWKQRKGSEMTVEWGSELRSTSTTRIHTKWCDRANRMRNATNAFLLLSLSFHIHFIRFVCSSGNCQTEMRNKTVPSNISNGGRIVKAP